MIAAAPIVISISNLQLFPGSRVKIENVVWDDYELLLEMGSRSYDRYSSKVVSQSIKSSTLLKSKNLRVNVSIRSKDS